MKPGGGFVLRFTTEPLAFVDIETTGGHYTNSRVLELGVVRVEQGKIVGSLSQLLDPGTSVSFGITQLTGITNADVADAPAFAEIALKFVELIDGAIFVAHNVRFDYSFLKMELGRMGVPFVPKMVCTVRLAKKLLPGHRGYR